MEKIQEQMTGLNTIYFIIVVFLILTFTLTLSGIGSGIYYFFTVPEEQKFYMERVLRLIVPFGIILSAALASVSVLKSITNANMIEKSKEKKEKEETKARLEFYLSDLKQLLVAYKDLKTYAHIDVATRIIIKIQKNLDNDKKIISQFSKTKLTDLSYDMHVISSLEALNNIDTNNSVVSKELLKVVKETLTSMEKNMNILEKENNLLITKNH